MATLNPLEQKARSSFRKGLFLAGIIGALICVGLGVLIFQMKGQEKQRLDNQVSVQVLKTEKKSGEIISAGDIVSLKVDKEAVPAGYAKTLTDLTTDQFDASGNRITLGDDGKHYLHIQKEDNAATSDVDEGEHQLFDDNGGYYYKIGTINDLYELGQNLRIYEDDDGNSYTYINGTKVSITQNSKSIQEGSDSYFAIVTIQNRETTVPIVISNISVTLSDTVYTAKIDLPKNTILTGDMVTTAGESVSNDLRWQEYNVIVLPVDLTENETIDVRLRLPSGEDYIVVSKKIVEIPSLSDGKSATTIKMKLSEEETLLMSSAIIDTYKMSGAKLYATKYTDPGLQETATETYAPSADTIRLINSDPNILDVAKNSLLAKYQTNYGENRQKIQDSINKVEETTQKSSVTSGTQAEESTATSERQQFLEAVTE